MARLSARDRRIDKILKRTSWKIGDREYRVAYCAKIEQSDDLGYCDTEAAVLYIKDGQTYEASLSTLFHEIMHAFEHEYRIKISHRAVYKLENAILALLSQNELI